MRLASFSVSVAVASIVLMSFPAIAQQAPEATVAPPPYVPSTVGMAPPASHPPIPVPDPEQEVPLAPVKTAPCSVPARETDGTTTCIGIPSESRGTKRRR